MYSNRGKYKRHITLYVWTLGRLPSPTSKCWLGLLLEVALRYQILLTNIQNTVQTNDWTTWPNHKKRENVCDYWNISKLWDQIFRSKCVVSVACHDSKFLLLQYALSINSNLLLGRIVCDTMLTLSATEDVWSRDCVIK